MQIVGKTRNRSSKIAQIKLNRKSAKKSKNLHSKQKTVNSEQRTRRMRVKDPLT